MWLVIHNLLGQCRSVVAAQARLLFPVAGMSAFWNNTPLVAVLLPAVQDWARKYQLPEVIRRIARHDEPMVDRERMNLPIDELLRSGFQFAVAGRGGG